MVIQDTQTNKPRHTPHTAILVENREYCENNLFCNPYLLCCVLSLEFVKSMNKTFNVYEKNLVTSERLDML